MSFTNEQLDTVLFHMASNSKEIPTRPDLICQKAGLSLQKETAYLLLNKLHFDKYVTKANAQGAFYTINGNGIAFINEGGYAEKAKHEGHKKLHERWQFWLAILIAILTAAALLK